MPGVTITVAYIISCYFILHTGCQIITLCSNPVKNGSCTITCTTPDTSKDVVFYLETTNKGSCFVSLSFCTTDVTQTGNVTSLAFSSLSKNAHEGSWTCNYGNLPSSPQSLIVYTEPTVTTFINESSTPPDERKKIKEVNLAARSYCFFPSVSSANLLYKDLTSSQFIKLSENSVVGVSGTSLGCETYEQDLQVNITVNIDNAQYKELAGKTVYFQITFTNALGTTYSTNELGPYAFEDQEQINSACGSFHCGFWLLWLVIVTSIIILFLMWKKVKRFGFSASGFSNMKIGITAVFSVVAIGTGIGLGLGLREGQANCLECEATVGISIALGVILSVGQFILFICCCKEKGCDGNSEGETSDRSNGDRARTPASATGINLEAKKKSQNKPTEKGTEASSLTSKSFGYPLPGTPNTRKNQLEPLKTDSFEVENPSTERKKKKKRKKKKETSEGNEASEEKEERPELEF